MTSSHSKKNGCGQIIFFSYFCEHEILFFLLLFLAWWTNSYFIFIHILTKTENRFSWMSSETFKLRLRDPFKYPIFAGKLFCFRVIFDLKFVAPHSKAFFSALIIIIISIIFQLGKALSYFPKLNFLISP